MNFPSLLNNTTNISHPFLIPFAPSVIAPVAKYKSVEDPRQLEVIGFKGTLKIE